DDTPAQNPRGLATTISRSAVGIACDAAIWSPGVQAPFGVPQLAAALGWVTWSFGRTVTGVEGRASARPSQTAGFPDAWRCGTLRRRRGSGALQLPGVVEDDAERIALAAGHRAEPVPHLNAIDPARAAHGPFAVGERDAGSCRRVDRGRARLAA